MIIMKKYLFKIKKLIILLITFDTLASIVSILTPIISANLISSLTKFNIHNSYKYAIIFFSISIFGVLLARYSNIIYMKMRESLLFNIRFDMISRLFHLKTKNFDEVSSGKFQERIKQDPKDITTVFSIVQYNIFGLLTGFFILIYVYFLNVFIGLIYTLGVIIIYFYEKITYKKYEELDKRNMVLHERNGTILNEILKGIRDIKLLNVAKKVNRIASDSLNKQTKIDTDMSIMSRSIHNTVTLMEAVVTFVMVVMGIYLIQNKFLTLTSFLIIFLYRKDIFTLVISYTSLKEYLVKYKVAKNRINELFDEKKFPIDKFGKEKLENVKGDIEFKDVSFAYKKKEVIHNLSFKVKANSNIALVGKSGSGKSTIFNLLTKSYDNYKGLITIDGVDIKKLDYKSLRDSISIITQNPYIFNLSVKDNLKLIDREVTEKEIVEACKVARIHDYIMSLPDEYDTLLGEGGITFSGGQRQRLAIARALLKGSKILLFDEATSALDNVTQNEIQMAIDDISKNYTIITIAHRLSTIVNSDIIFIIEDGAIIDSGKHEQLLKRNRHYKELYKK